MEKRKKETTSWGGVADWYNSYLETTEDSYQKQVILPNLLRVLGIKPGMKLIDIACGQGFFSREFANAGAEVVGSDIAQSLIAQAKKLSGKTVQYYVAPADNLNFTKSEVFDAATIVLAVQNIKDIEGAFKEAKRVLKPGGRLVMVLMHPAFRIPQHTSWGFDDVANAQYRRVDAYLSAQKSELLVHPGKQGSAKTISYHRSLQDFSKALFKTGFAITRLEEWISHKQSQKGPRQKAEDTARKEFPLFLMIEARTI
jgi:ubiquinone/menaquinone biosynthesis C-methylase UbiE